MEVGKSGPDNNTRWLKRSQTVYVIYILCLIISY